MSLLRRWLTCILLCVSSLSFAALGNDQKTLLLINSYSENAPWSQSFMTPLRTLVDHVDKVHIEIANLNSRAVTDSTTFEEISDRIFDAYSSRHPEYVIMIGNMSFQLRDRIRQEWGDIPMLLISRTDRYAPLDYYFAGYTEAEDWDLLPHIADIRDQYNMTAIVTPDFTKETIDLMAQSVEGLQNVVFMSDASFTNRVLDKRIKRHLSKNYPQMKYRWLQANDSANTVFQEYMLNPQPNTAILINTWSNHSSDDKMKGLFGGNLAMISAAVNPVFSLRDSYLSIGAIGGVYNDPDEASDALSYVVEKMLTDGDMRRLPMFVCDTPTPRVNHRRMINLGLDEADFPKNTQYVLRQPSVWESYKFEIISVCVILLLLIAATSVYITIQRKRITLLKTHASFIKNMPWGYSPAKILYDPNGHIIDIEYQLNNMNEAFMTLLSENLMPQHKWKMFPFKFIAEKAQQLVDTGQPVSFTYHFESTDTYYEFLLCRIKPEKLKPGERIHSVDLFANDITKQVRAQRKLRTTMRTLDITLNVARIIPWQWDLLEGQIRYDGFHTMRGLRTTEDYENVTTHYSMSEADFIASIHPDDRERVVAMIEAYKRGELSHKRAEFKLTIPGYKKTRTEWVEINSATTEYTDDGHPRTILGSLLVITERKKQEDALIAAKEQASESDRMKSAFLANMSHEIRTPLNAIVGFSSLIAQTDDQQEKIKYTGIIERNNDLLLHLINDVLDLAKIESNTLDLNMVAVDLNELMRSVYDTVRLRVKDGVMFNMVLGSDECNLRTDPNRLTQVLVNLLTNAAKFTTKGSISYGYEVNDDEIEFFVRDTGIGISKENQAKLFHRFSKLNSFVPGTGLGLSICKSFIEKMGGTIWVKSRGEGKGTTFYFTLPYEHVEQPQQLHVTEGTILTTPIEESNGNVTILVAEDNDSNYLLFESILSKSFKLLHARNGREAVEMFRQHEPQLILMDIRMPEMDGFEATAEIRKLSQTVPIIAVTAHAFVTDKDRIMRSGFNGYVAKPINQQDLLTSVKTQLGKRFFIF